MYKQVDVLEILNDEEFRAYLGIAHQTTNTLLNVIASFLCRKGYVDNDDILPAVCTELFGILIANILIDIPNEHINKHALLLTNIIHSCTRIDNKVYASLKNLRVMINDPNRVNH